LRLPRPRLGTTREQERLPAHVELGEGLVRQRRIGRGYAWKIARRKPRQLLERQPKADRRISRDEAERAAAGAPALAHPAPLPAPRGQRGAAGVLEAALEHRREPRPLLWVAQTVVERVDVHREVPLLQQVVERVLVRRERARRIHLETSREPEHEPLGQLDRRGPRRGGRPATPQPPSAASPAERRSTA